MNVNTSIGGFGIEDGSVFNMPKQSSENRGAFWSALSAACAEKPGSSDMLFQDKSRARAKLTDGDIAALAAKYDPSNMTGKQYQEFLQDLEELGAITADDHTRMGNYCLTMWVTSYTDSSGREVKLTREEAEARFGKSGDSLSVVDGDLMKMLRSMWKSRPGERGRLEILLDIVEQIWQVESSEYAAEQSLLQTRGGVRV